MRAALIAGLVAGLPGHRGRGRHRAGQRQLVTGLTVQRAHVHQPRRNRGPELQRDVPVRRSLLPGFPALARRGDAPFLPVPGPERGITIDTAAFAR